MDKNRKLEILLLLYPIGRQNKKKQKLFQKNIFNKRPIQRYLTRWGMQFFFYSILFVIKCASIFGLLRILLT